MTVSEAGLLETFTEERSCVYRDESYSVRDNGAVFRRARPRRRRQLDETWTFGSPSSTDGYMSISAHKVHRIVATAFHGEQPSPGHIVDHLDTNRRNNRPDNLRWVTRLENILLNPITAKRVVALYGSIEEFLIEPSNPKNGKPSVEFEWMRAVSAEEAAYCRQRLLSWAQSDRRSSGGGSLGDWIFGNRAQSIEPTDAVLTVQSRTPGAVQRSWKVPAEFPLCPDPDIDQPLDQYYARLKVGETFVISPFGETKIDDAAWSSDGSAILILGEHGKDAIKPWSLAKVTYEDRRFVHESLGTFFGRDGAEKSFVIGQGRPWEGGEVFDDYA